MIDSVYWIWMQLLFGFGTARSHKIMQEHDSPQQLYEMLSSDQPTYNLLYANEKKNWKECMERAESIKQATLRKGCAIVTPDHPNYPPLLHHIYAKPAALYVKGDISVLKDNLSFTIVGTRRNSKYGANTAYSLAKGLATRGATILSGLAFGIDSISHAGALDAGGKTIGVLACGLDIDYPKGNAEIKSKVSQNGAVMSEYPMGMKPKPYMFPPRNRVLAGMSHGVIVVEAGDKSGALITARHGLEFGREVFVVPGSMFSGSFAGSHALIRDGQAKLVTSPDDILEEYTGIYLNKSQTELDETRPEETEVPTSETEEAEVTEEKKKIEKIYGIGINPVSEKSKKGETGFKIEKKADTLDKGTKETSMEIRIKKELPSGIDQSVEMIYAIIDQDKTNADKLAFETNLPIEEVLGALTTLELLGLVESYPGGYFAIA